MAKRRSTAATRRQIVELPEKFLQRVLPGAARAGAEVIADAAKDLLGDRSADTENGGQVLIASSVKVKVRRKDGQIRARIMLEGPGAYVGRWLEYGTDPHFISVSDTARAGRTVTRINTLAREGSLVIGGQFVGQSVFHPGAQAKPFLRPALDLNEAEAIAAAQSYITARGTRAGIVAAQTPEVDA